MYLLEKFQLSILITYGVTGASVTFQRMIGHEIRDEWICLDDLIIYNVSWEDRLVHIQAVLDRLQTLGLMVKPCKCQLAMRVVLGGIPVFLMRYGTKVPVKHKTKIEMKVFCN